MSVYLFSLHEYEGSFTQLAGKTVRELMAKKDPILGSVKSVLSEQIPIVQNTMPSGEVVEGKPMRTELRFALEIDDIVAGDLDKLAAALDATATDGLKQVMPKFFERIGELTNAVGNTVDARGQPLTFELLLQGFERVQVDFDEEGNPILPKLVVGPEMYAAFQKLPPPTEEQQKLWDEMIERKRREFNDNRRHRKLS